jgi:hypothetical protein
METESQDVPLLSPLPDSVESIKVFPFIIHLKRDVIVSERQLESSFSLKPSPAHIPSHLRHGVVEEPRFVFLFLDSRTYPYMSTSADTALSWEFVSALLTFQA